MKSGLWLLIIGLAVGGVSGNFIAGSLHGVSWATAGKSFVNGVGVGAGSTIGLLLMIFIFKTCDRLLASPGAEKKF